MFIRKMHLPRRTVLRGLGATLALPLLDSMVPALTALSKTAARPIRRLGVFYVPNGMSMPYWSPQQVGPLSKLPPTLRSLAGLEDRVLLCGGLDDESANLVSGGGDHARSAGTFLTCVPFKLTSGADVYASVSMDQIAARELAKETQLASIELGIESSAMLGSCDAGASCAYTNTVAWRTPTTPLPVENDPRAVFERLFGTSGSTDPAARLARMRKDRSVLDAVNEELSDLEREIGPGDQLKLDEYLSAVRDAERRIEMAERQNTRELPLVDQPIGTPSDYAEHAELMMDLLALAYQTDLTRISSFMLAREVSVRAYPEIGVFGFPPSAVAPPGQAGQPGAAAPDQRIPIPAVRESRQEAGRHTRGGRHDARFHAAALWDRHQRQQHPLPRRSADCGDCRQRHRRDGRPLRPLSAGTPLANLYMTILEKMGFPLEKFGDSTGLLKNLSV